MTHPHTEGIKERKQYRSSEELQMRELIVPVLRKRYPTARIIHELPLRYSSNRIDLAAVTETEIVSVEIKSSRDVADRLEVQLKAFAPVSTRIIAALAPKWNVELPMLEKQTKHGTCHYSQYTEAQEAIRRAGSCYEIETWTVDAEKKTVDTGHSYTRNGHPWPYRMLHILHVAELMRIADDHRISYGKRATHESLADSCSDHLSGKEVRRAVCGALRARDAFCNGTDAPIALKSRAAVGEKNG